MRIRRLELASFAGALVLAGAGACESRGAWEVVVASLRASEEATLVATGGREAWDRFGFSVALSSDGSRALVSAPTDHNVGDLYAGSLHIFLRKGMTWTEEATLFGGPGDHFGHSVALSSDASRALVGAYGDGPSVGENTGSARVLLRTGTTWTEEATLLASDGAPSDFFGQAVALSADGSWALVGVPGDGNSGGIRAGSVRVFQRTGTTWAEQAAPLIASPGVGQTIALSSDGSRALIGVPGADTAGGVRTGSVRVFLRTDTTWTEEATLLAADGAADDGFGQSVALSSDGSRALVGASSDDTTLGANTGSAHVFLRSGVSWTEEATLLASGASHVGAGFAVALSSDGSRALLGLLFDNVTGGNAGSVRVFGRTGTSWTEDATLVAADDAATDYFGSAVALSSDGSRALVGASGYNTESGRAHVFTLAPDASTGAAGAGGTGGATGSGGTGGATGTAGEGGTTGGTTGTAGGSGGGGGTGADAAADGGGDDPKTGSGGCGCDCRVASGAPATVPVLVGIALVLAARRRRRGPSP